MSHKIRLGPIAIFLTVVAIVLSTLAVLTVATSNADRVMAQRFADVTQIRYELEADGARFLQAAAEAAADGRDVGEDTDATPLTDGGYACALEREGYTLRIEITQPDGAGNFEITKWKISKNWDMEDPMDNVWKG
ncbi:MAG: hypothetical protein IJ751_04290 [Oscillospiraceae bacterium]|nr:hypothetical protein [Oscillospiraceae bacterium]